MTQELPKVTDRYSAEEIEGFYKAGYWRDQTLIDLVDHWAAQRPGEVFATDGTTSLTFGDLRERAYRVLAVHRLHAADTLQLAAALVATNDRPGGHTFFCADSHLAGAAGRD